MAIRAGKRRALPILCLLDQSAARDLSLSARPPCKILAMPKVSKAIKGIWQLSSQHSQRNRGFSVYTELWTMKRVARNFYERRSPGGGGIWIFRYQLHGRCHQMLARRLRPNITRRRRKAAHLRNRVTAQAENTGSLTTGPTLNKNELSDRGISPHRIHPPPTPPSRKGSD
jgi:hypothetical protein